MPHYNPRHISSINMPIFRRTNCIITASGIVALCKRLYSMPDESRLQSSLLLSGILYRTVLPEQSGLIRHTVLYCTAEQSALIRHTVQPFTQSDDTRCCDNTICPPEDGHVNARNMTRIVM